MGHFSPTSTVRIFLGRGPGPDLGIKMTERPGADRTDQRYYGHGQFPQRTPKNGFLMSSTFNPSSTLESPVFLPVLSVRNRRQTQALTDLDIFVLSRSSPVLLQVISIWFHLYFTVLRHAQPWLTGRMSPTGCQTMQALHSQAGSPVLLW